MLAARLHVACPVIELDGQRASGDSDLQIALCCTMRCGEPGQQCVDARALGRRQIADRLAALDQQLEDGLNVQADRERAGVREQQLHRVGGVLRVDPPQADRVRRGGVVRPEIGQKAQGLVGVRDPEPEVGDGARDVDVRAVEVVASAFTGRAEWHSTAHRPVARPGAVAEPASGSRGARG